MSERSPVIIDEIAVVIPANDEEELLAECLAAIDVARARTPSGPSVRVIVVLDDCVDRSASIVHGWPDVHAVEVSWGNVGASRAAGVSHAVKTTGAGHASRLWIANTDADSIVPPDWLQHQLVLARAGTELMLGSISPNPRDLSVDQYRRWRERRRDDRSRHVHGANLGVRADHYLAADGFRPAREHEDIGLADRIARSGAIIAAACCEVVTSARTTGRTPGGYAAHVRAHY